MPAMPQEPIVPAAPNAEASGSALPGGTADIQSSAQGVSVSAPADAAEDTTAMAGAGAMPDLQPAPAVIDAESHVDLHVLPRRFLGPMPQSVVTSDRTMARRERFRQLRRKSMGKLLHRERVFQDSIERDIERGLSDEADDDAPQGSAPSKRHRFRVRRRDNLNIAHDTDFDINESDSDTSSSSSDDESTGWFGGSAADVKKQKKKDKKKQKKKDKRDKAKDKPKKKKGKKKKKDKQFRVWVGGDGFDIGREFKTATGNSNPDAAIDGNPDASLALNDKMDVLVDEIDALQESEDVEEIRDDLWSTTGVPGMLLPPGESTSKGKAVATDDGSFYTAQTKPSMQSLQASARAAHDPGRRTPTGVMTPTHAPTSHTLIPASYSTIGGDSFVTAQGSSAQGSSAQASSHLGSSHLGSSVDRGDVGFETLLGSFDAAPSTPPHLTAPPLMGDHLIPEMTLGLRRPVNSRGSTVDTFRTAREVHSHDHDHHNDSDADSFFATGPHMLPPQHHIAASPYGSEANSSPSRGCGSSVRPLLASDDEGPASPSGTVRGKPDTEGKKVRRQRSSISSVSAQSLRAIPQRLKSALRAPTATTTPIEVDTSPKKPMKTVTWTAEDNPKGVKGKAKQLLSRVDTSITNPVSPILGAGALKPSLSVKKARSPAGPVDPMEVLRRSGDEIRNTSTAAQEDATVIDNDDFMPGGIVMRDRVLVKVGRHRSEDIVNFDEAYQRRDPCYRYEPLEEYVVGMTMTTVDFYVDWTFQCQERWQGYKRLRYSIPLSPPTRLSVFNSRDMMLCLTCSWPVITRATERKQDPRRSGTKAAWDKVKHKPMETLGLERGGMGVFLLKFGERSRALDWHWYICQQLDLRLPKQIDIRVPALSQTIRMAIPDEAASTSVNTDTTLRLLWGTVMENSTHREVLRDLGTLPRIELAWKGPDATLDWVAYGSTVTGRNREWALLASFAQALQDGKRAMLQARTAKHRAVKVVLDDRTKMEEPPGVEGYLTWHRGAAGPKELVYVSSSEGVVFVAPPSVGVPPLLPKREGSTPADLFPEVQRTFIAAQHRRLTQFIEKCTGCIDLRDIVEVQLRKPPSESFDMPSPTSSHHVSARKVVDKEGDKKHREFTVTFRNGHVVTFEAHTPAVAAEWTERLSQLVKYWTLYHRVAARQDMDASRLHAKTLVNALDLHAEDLLNNVWDWCVIDGCRGLTGGRMFIKRGRFRKFKAVYVAVTGGAMVTFRIRGATGLQRRRHVWPLFGSYIYSGMLAQDELRETVNEVAFNPSARMYSDGMRSTDGAEDTTFCVRVTWPTGAFAGPQPWDKDSDDEDEADSAGGPAFIPPRLSSKPSQLLICRARSRLERDRWVWAINAEKERCARSHVGSEERLRNFGNLPRSTSIMHTDGTADSRPAWRRTSTSSSSSR